MSNWPRIPLEHVLIERKEAPSSDALITGEIPIVAKVGFDDGQIQLRVGGQTKTGMILIRPGDLVVSGINAAKGAIAVYRAENTQPIAATIHYGAYIPNKERVDISFLWWLLRSRTFKELLLRYVPGGIKTELKAKRFLPVPIPLPPLPEQRRVVARIESLAAKIDEARGLRQKAVDQAKMLGHANSEAMYQNIAKGHGYQTVAAISRSITDGDHITPSFVDEGVKFIFVGNVSTGRLHFEGAKYVSLDYFASLKTQRVPARGDILYSAVGATLGVPAVVDSDEPFCFQRHVAILKPDPSRIDSRFLWHMLRSRTVFKKAWTSTTGSAQPTVPLRAIRELPIPLPSLPEQHCIVAYLDSLQIQVDAMKRLQSQAKSEIDALLPSILDKAFKGEL